MLRKYTGRDSRRVLGRFSRASKEMACACALWPVACGCGTPIGRAAATVMHANTTEKRRSQRRGFFLFLACIISSILCAGLLASNSMCRFFLEGRVYYLASYKWSVLDGFLIH